MIRRIVHMEFEPEHVPAFLELFEASCQKIRQFPGCLELTLLQDVNLVGRMTTYSLWDSAEALEAYRASELFQSTWKRTKPMSSGKPSAVSYRVVRHLP